jgi:hypothetical protein
VTRTVGYFLAGVLCGWSALAAAGYALQRDYGLLCAVVAGLICIVPTTISLAMAIWTRGKSGSEQLMAVVAGMGLRMAVVLGVSLAIFLKVPYFRESQARELTFWGFVLVSYLATLAWETFLAARDRESAPPPANGVGG